MDLYQIKKHWVPEAYRLIYNQYLLILLIVYVITKPEIAWPAIAWLGIG